MERLFLGLDLGVNSLKAIICGHNLHILKKDWEPVRGNLFSAIKTLLQRSLSGFEDKEIIVSVTGNGQAGLEFPEEVLKINEITALACGASGRRNSQKDIIKSASSIDSEIYSYFFGNIGILILFWRAQAIASS
jgi:activator of 2-hydroxyglutaryl-CoA dehydratase